MVSKAAGGCLRKPIFSLHTQMRLHFLLRAWDTRKTQETSDGLIFRSSMWANWPTIHLRRKVAIPLFFLVAQGWRKKLKSRHDILIHPSFWCALPSRISFLVSNPKNQEEETGRNEKLSYEMQGSWLIATKGKGNIVILVAFFRKLWFLVSFKGIYS